MRSAESSPAASALPSHRGVGANPRFSRFCQATWLLAVPLLLVAGVASAAVPFTPASDAVVLERVAVPLSGERRELRLAQQSLAQRPQDAALAAVVAQRAIALGRSEADPRYFGYAEAALQPWWMQAAPPEPLLLLRATLLQQRHDFTSALNDLNALLQRNPQQSQARLTRAVIAQVQARYAPARADCAALIVQDFFAGSVCMAGVQGLSGQGETALRLLDTALARAQVPAAEQVWAMTLAAEIAARLGRRDALSRFAAAVARASAAQQQDPYLLVAQADALLDRGQAQAVVAALAPLTRVDPALLRLAMAERVLGLPQADAHIELLRQRFAAATLRGDAVHRREQAMFELHLLSRAERALQLAEQNWQVQREPTDARILLQAAVAAQRPRAAAPVLSWMRESGIEDTQLRALAARLQAMAADA